MKPRAFLDGLITSTEVSFMIIWQQLMHAFARVWEGKKIFLIYSYFICSYGKNISDTSFTNLWDLLLLIAYQIQKYTHGKVKVDIYIRQINIQLALNAYYATQKWIPLDAYINILYMLSNICSNNKMRNKFTTLSELFHNRWNRGEIDSYNTLIYCCSLSFPC